MSTKLRSLLKKIDVMYLRDRIPRLYYQYCREKMPVDDHIVLLNSYHGDNLHGNIFYILTELARDERYQDLQLYVPVYPSRRKSYQELLESHGLSERVRLIGCNSTDYARILACAKYCIYDERLSFWQAKRPEQIFWQTWHGAGPKAAGRFSNLKAGPTINYQLCYAQANYHSDLFPTHTDYLMDAQVARALSRDAHVLASGYPRNDAFQRPDEIARARAVMGSPEKLYAYYPTFRSASDSSEEDRKSSMREHLSQLDDALNDDELMLVKFHMLEKAKIDLCAYKHLIGLPCGMENYEALAACDVLVSDYSSVMLDFAQAGKKVVVLSWDEEAYAQKRGWRVPPDDLPFPRVDNITSLVEELRRPINYDCSELLAPLVPHTSANLTKHLVEQVFLGIEHFDEHSLVNAGTSWALIVAGSSSKEKGVEHLLARARNLSSPSGKPAHLCFRSSYIKKHPELIPSFPPEINYLSWKSFRDVPFRQRSYTSGGWIGRMARFVLHPLLERAWHHEADRISGCGTWFEKAVCDCDAGTYFLMTVAHLNCDTTLLTTAEAFERCNKNLLRYAAPLYDHVVATDEQTAKRMREIVSCNVELNREYYEGCVVDSAS